MTSKTPYDDSPRKRRRGGTLVWGLMGFVILGLGGFGVSNFGGGVRSVGSVGDVSISTDEYRAALKQKLQQVKQMTGQDMTLAELTQYGLDAEVRSALATTAALKTEVAREGISASDDRVAAQILKMQEFQGVDGQFNRDIYRDVLKQIGQSETQFENDLRARMGIGVLQGAVMNGFSPSQTYVDTFYTYHGEKRAFSLLTLTEADLTSPLAEPTEADLKAFYDLHVADRYTRPETKRIQYVALLPDVLAATTAVDESEVRKLYDERIADYVVPERRLVERLVYPDQASADAAKAKLDAGATFEALVAERNLDLSDIDLGDVSKADLGAAGDAVFSVAEPGIVVGPLQSDLGPALFRMNGILEAQETTFDEAKPDLSIEYQREAARRAIGARVEEIDDLLAGGDTLEDLAKDQKMTLATVDFNTNSTDTMSGYAAFRDAATALQKGDFPQVIMLEDGGMVAMELKEIVPPGPMPFEDVKDKVAEAWRADALDQALVARGTEILKDVQAGAELSDYGILTVSSGMRRAGQMAGTPDGFMDTVFGLKAGGQGLVQGAGFTGVVQLDQIIPVDMASEEAKGAKANIDAAFNQSLGQDSFGLLSKAMIAKSGVRFDDAAINAVHALFP